MTLPNQQIGLTRPLLTSLVLENLDHVGRWTDEKGAYEAKALLAQDFFLPSAAFFFVAALPRLNGTIFAA
jgi:hypothetical protein